MEINQKFWSFSGEVFDKVYSEQLQVKLVVYNTTSNFSIALFRKENQEFH